MSLGDPGRDNDSVASLTIDPIVNEATKRFKLCSDWESNARDNFLDDYRFAHGDADNGFQWPNPNSFQSGY